MKAKTGVAAQLQMEENKEKQGIENPARYASRLLFILQSKVKFD